MAREGRGVNKNSELNQKKTKKTKKHTCAFCPGFLPPKQKLKKFFPLADKNPMRAPEAFLPPILLPKKKQIYFRFHPKRLKKITTM